MEKYILKTGEGKKALFTGSKEECETFLKENYNINLHPMFSIIPENLAKLDRVQHTDIKAVTEKVEKEAKRNDEQFNPKPVDDDSEIDGTFLQNRLTETAPIGKSIPPTENTIHMIETDYVGCKEFIEKIFMMDEKANHTSSYKLTVQKTK